MLRHYAIALVAVVAALILRYLLNPLLAQQGPYLILTLPIVVAAMYGGFGPALFATLLGTSFGTYLFIGHGPGLAQVLQRENISRTVLFLLIGASIGLIGGRLRASRHALADSVRHLRSSHRAKDNAMATLGHEIRNPLSALSTAQQLLTRCPDDPARVLWASEIIQRQVAQMTRMADDLLDLSGVMQGRVSIDRRRLVLAEVLQQALEQSSALIARKHHRLVTDFGDPSTAVQGDGERLVQVFANLLNNAAKYTDPGGALRLRVYTADANFIAVSIADDGTGMQPDAIDELFEPFVQAPGAASNAEGGLGLGLALVRKIVELHGGTVSGYSAGAGLGSVFTVRLPRAPG